MIKHLRGPLRIAETDTDPDGTPVALEFTDGSLTDQGNGVFLVDVTYSPYLPSVYGALVSKTTSYTLASGDLGVDCTTNSFTITLPTAVGVTNRIYIIKNSGTGEITINTTSSQTIDGQTSGTFVLAQYDCMWVMSNGSNWVIV